MKSIWLSLILALLMIVTLATPALAIDLPDSTPQLINAYAYRNVLETGDILIVLYENTPYATTPTDFSYSEAFIWRWIDTDNVTELGQQVGYNYNENGYGYNVIGFYFDSGNVTAKGIVYNPPGVNYVMRLSGNPAAFPGDIPYYDFIVESSSYSALTDTSQVKDAITNLVLYLAADLDNKWGLTATYSLISEGDTGTILSLYGQTFFRGAIYGIQAMAPDAFPLKITNINTTDRTWTTTYETALETQHAGTYIETAMNAGETLMNVNYNLLGLLFVLALVVIVIGGHWYLGGGNLFRGLVEGTPILVIGARMSMVGLGELGFFAAILWILFNLKAWKVL